MTHCWLDYKIRPAAISCRVADRPPGGPVGLPLGDLGDPGCRAASHRGGGPAAQRHRRVHSAPGEPSHHRGDPREARACATTWSSHTTSSRPATPRVHPFRSRRSGCCARARPRVVTSRCSSDSAPVSPTRPRSWCCLRRSRQPRRNSTTTLPSALTIFDEFERLHGTVERESRADVRV